MGDLKTKENTDRFWARVDKSDSCWVWTGSKTTAGYGNLRVARDSWDYAHRVSYRLAIGPIPDGLVIDHLCRNRSCVNPDHLEAVTHTENVRRGAGAYGPAKTTCVNGHDMTTPLNVYENPRGYRVCRTCTREHEAKRRSPNWPRTHCPQGHAYDASNTYITPAGHRQCRECNRIRSAARSSARKNRSTP